MTEKEQENMKGLLIILFDIASIIILTAAAYAERGYYAFGGEVLLIAAILIFSLCQLETNVSRETTKRSRRR